MSNLEKVVEGIDGISAIAVGVFQIQAAVFLHVETLILYGKSYSASFAGDGIDIVGRDRQGRQPGESRGIPVGGFFADNGVEVVRSLLIVDMPQIVYPPETLPDVFRACYSPNIIRLQFETALEFTPQRSGTAWFEGDDK